jgi:methyl-accepting chemotaxis protein
MEQGPPTPHKIKTSEIHKTVPHKGPEKGHGLFYYLLLLCFFGSLIPYLITTSVTCSTVKRSFRQEAFNHLISVRDIKRQELENYFLDRKADTYALATSPLIVRAAATFINAFKQGGIEGNLYKEADINYGRMLDEFCSAHEYYDILIADMEGNIVVSAKDFPIQGKNSPSVYADTPLAEAFKTGKSGINIGDMRWHEPYKGPAIFVSSPLVMRLTGERTPVGVLVAHVNPIKINEMMSQRPGLGETGETYLVGQDLLMRSDSRFTQESQMLRKQVDTVAVREALAGQTNCRIIRNYRDKKVLSAYTPLDISESTRWALIAEIDKSEALGLEDTISSRMTYLSAAMIPLWGIIIFIFYKLIRAWHRHELVHPAPAGPHGPPPHGPKA